MAPTRWAPRAARYCWGPQPSLTWTNSWTSDQETLPREMPANNVTESSSFVCEKLDFMTEELEPGVSAEQSLTRASARGRGSQTKSRPNTRRDQGVKCIQQPLIKSCHAARFDLEKEMPTVIAFSSSCSTLPIITANSIVRSFGQLIAIKHTFN